MTINTTRKVFIATLISLGVALFITTLAMGVAYLIGLI